MDRTAETKQVVVDHKHHALLRKVAAEQDTTIKKVVENLVAKHLKVGPISQSTP